LVPGGLGTEALEELVLHAREWLAPGAPLVLELAPHQADEMAARAEALGYAEVFVRDDLAGRPRVLVARTE
jgi:methylase of polypeptide subunit release factors